MRKIITMTILCMSFLLTGCNVADPPKEPQEEIKEMETKEPTKEGIAKAEETNFEEVKLMEDIDSNMIPQVYQGYFIAKRKLGGLVVYDKEGNLVTGTEYKEAVYSKDGSLYLVTPSNQYESFGYAIGKEVENKVSGFDSSVSEIIAYNTDSGDIVATHADAQTPKWYKKTDPQQGTYVIHSVSDVESANKDGNVYYWNTYTNKVYGPYEKPSDRYVRVYSPNEYTTYISTIYPVKANADNLWQIVDKDRITEKEYTDAQQVGLSAVFGVNGENCIIIDTLDNQTVLPEDTDLSTALNDDHILLKKNGKWYLYAKHTEDS